MLLDREITCRNAVLIIRAALEAKYMTPTRCSLRAPVAEFAPNARLTTGSPN